MDTVSANLRDLFGDESQRITAEKLGVSIAIVGYWRNGKARPGYEVLLKISEVYDASVDWILGRPGSVRTRDPVLEELCHETGLSVKSVKNLKRIPFKATLNRVLENPLFFDYLESMEQLSSTIYRLDTDLEKFAEIKKSGTDPISCEMAVKEDIDLVRMQRYETNECAMRVNEAVYNGARAIRKGKRIFIESGPRQSEESTE